MFELIGKLIVYGGGIVVGLTGLGLIVAGVLLYRSTTKVK
jgi:hypothetical protein